MLGGVRRQVRRTPRRRAAPVTAGSTDGLREVRAAGDLVIPLTADATEPDAELVCTHEADLLSCHARDSRRGTGPAWELMIPRRGELLACRSVLSDSSGMLGFGDVERLAGAAAIPDAAGRPEGLSLSQ